MPWYNDLRPTSDEKKQNFSLVFPKESFPDTSKKQTITHLLNLRKGLFQNIPPKRADKNLLIASWNIKEFGHLNNRMPEAYYYIAEIINSFDLVAVQEVKRGLDDLMIVMRLLGSNWTYIITDITEGGDGNRERFAYVYDKRRVQFTGLSGEIVLWDDITRLSNMKQLKRTPHITGFKAGWKSFAILNLHLQPGNSTTSRDIRKEEVKLLMNAIEEKKRKNHFWTTNLMLMGDFNLYKNNTEIVQLINSVGFKEVTDLAGKNTNVSNTEVFDRIFYLENKYFTIHDVPHSDTGGVFHFFDYVFTEAGVKAYHQHMLNHKEDNSNLTSDQAFLSYYKSTWRRNQLSDHFPIWVQMSIDSTDDFLANKLNEFT